MADQTIIFSGQKATANTLNNLNSRIRAIFTNANTTNVQQFEKINFSDLVKIYESAQSAMFALANTSSNQNLGNYQNQQIGGITGLGIVEKTVGDLENLCLSHNSSNVLSNSTHRTDYMGASNSSNFSNNQSAACPSNRSTFTSSKNSTNFSGNEGFCDTNQPFTWMSYCDNEQHTQWCSPFCTPNYASVMFSNCKSDFNDPTCEGNRSSFTASKNSSNFSGNTANSTNRSTFTEASNSSNFSIFNCPANFVNYEYQCKVVHNIFSVEGVDF